MKTYTFARDRSVILSVFLAVVKPPRPALFRRKWFIVNDFYRCCIFFLDLVYSMRRTALKTMGRFA